MHKNSDNSGARRLVLALAAVLVAGVAAPRPATAQEVVKIGAIQAQTGPINTYGWINSQGMKLAVDQVNKAGGFVVAGKTYKIQFFNPDTQGNPQQALIQLKSLLEQEHVKYVFGPFLTNVYKGIEPYADGFNGKFLLLGGATAMHYDLGKPNHDYVIREWNWDAGPAGFGTLMVKLLKDHGVKKVAMLMQNDAFGHVASDIYAPLFQSAGIAFDQEWYEPGTTDFTSVLAKIAAGKPDYLFPGYSDAQLYDIIHQATDVGLKKFWLVRGSLGPCLKNKDALDDCLVYIPKYFEDAQKEPKIGKFISDYKAYYKADFPFDQAPLLSCCAYDHLFWLINAMKKAGTVDDVAKVRQALISSSYSGLWNYRFDKAGEEVFNFDVVDIKKGGKIDVTHIAPK